MPARGRNKLAIDRVVQPFVLCRAVARPLFLLAVLALGCGTVDTGDNFVAPDLMLDEDFFYCRIQPEVITAHSCASGAAGEGGMCHSSMSALRLSPTAETVAPPNCEDGRVVGGVPDPYIDNFTAVQLSVQTDPLSSPFYRRPVGLDSHPRVIFPEGSPEADLIVQWISMGGM